MSTPRRYLMVHGHFYQPPRENPWTGQIEPQPSAAPWPDWNCRIAAECYLPMARSRVYDSAGRVADLYNNYAHSSFNFGPTLLSWLAEKKPAAIGLLRDAAAMNRSSAMAQSYSHMMLPLADSRDRHTQILWGLREFNRRFGHYPEGMWLPECGIDRETVRSLVDHGVKFVILSPHQASKARPFGERNWRDVSMGAIDTGRAYRLFETDGGGRTHFDRRLDILFYTPGLNLKVSFDHILNRPDDLARELEKCFDPPRSEGSLASIVTDGEIYGHHEKDGESALARLFTRIAPAVGLTVTTAGGFILDNPPSWEVKLWDGEDKNGSSWSCEHGMGRWSRDCGCTPSHNPGWNQLWRRPLRDAFDVLRDHIRGVTRRFLGALLWDRDDARNDYIHVVLDQSHAARRRFLERHAQRRLSVPEQGAVWRLLEAERNAMLMYTSCGWFFDELSGLEPVQNMRYALRAAELAEPYSDVDLVELLADKLALARSNLPRWKDGRDVFRRLVEPSRYTDEELAAAAAVTLALDGVGFSDVLSWRLVERGNCETHARNGKLFIAGSFVCLDPCLDRFVAAAWLVDMTGLESCRVILRRLETTAVDRFADEPAPPPLPAIDPDWLDAAMNAGDAGGNHVVGVGRLPAILRGMVYRLFRHGAEKQYLTAAAALGEQAAGMIRTANRFEAAPPESARAAAVFYVERAIDQLVDDATARASFSDSDIGHILAVRRTAEELDFWASQEKPARHLGHLLAEILHWLDNISDPAWFPALPKPRRLAAGSWLRPQARLNAVHAYPEAGPFALAQGFALAKWRQRLLDGGDPAGEALSALPYLEILVFARKGGFVIPHDLGVGRIFWDFLSKPLVRLIADNPADIIAGPVGDRLREAGLELGFSDKAMDRRLLAATKVAMNDEGYV